MTKTVMVVDDDIPNLTVMGLLLKKIGYEAITINNGWDALSAIQEKMPDLILLDLMMTPIDGWQVLDELKKAGLDGVPVMLFTAKYIRDEEIAPYKDDIVLILQKPVSFKELEATLQDYFSKTS
ncbi:MAG: response regulator [Methanocalculus sp. MSAO_Arc1]|uniref:response regulator n=1 Tax=Methanocalculus TaxID=71151 RepID=UPI000FF2BBA8|nr:MULTISPECIES: response regulator [unclassified Methanocalculus]MCP1662011.1 CheY-like chemotaxis protein [Methanocalculus sp. AMF5]RQD79623.1 MAG: response regulator [Methanocalculus sp. MSAO_Arc1]